MKRLIMVGMALCFAVSVSAQQPPEITSLTRRYKELEAMHPFEVVQKYDFGYDYDKKGERLWPLVKCPVKPLIDEPLRDASICRGPDGMYYLTGTTAPDFQSMLQIKLWRSSDGVNWKPMGAVFDLTDPKLYVHPQKTANRWMQRFNLNPNHPELGMVRGITSPEIHYMKDTFWIIYSMNDLGVGLLKSTTGGAKRSGL